MGPPGRRGARGATGAKTGKLGHKGPRGLSGLPGPFNERDVLNAVVPNFDDVYEQLTGQMKLIAQLRQQLAEIAARCAAMPADGTERPCPKTCDGTLTFQAKTPIPAVTGGRVIGGRGMTEPESAEAWSRSAVRPHRVDPSPRGWNKGRTMTQASDVAARKPVEFLHDRPVPEKTTCDQSIATRLEVCGQPAVMLVRVDGQERFLCYHHASRLYNRTFYRKKP